MTIKDKAVPNVVGVDIGCGMYTVNLGNIKIDFEKVQFRVAKVLTCEAVKKTKLLKFELQIGDEKRTIVSGIQKYYKPEELIGKKLVVCTNLKPRKICGIESQGMIISAWDDKDNLSVLTLDKDIIEGAEIG